MANLAVVAAGTDGRSASLVRPADVVVDLAAWAPATAGGPPAGPVRLADTRSPGALARSTGFPRVTAVS